LRDCLNLDGLRGCATNITYGGVFKLVVAVPGRVRPTLVEIGLAGNGMTARTILYSLRVSRNGASTRGPQSQVAAVERVVQEANNFVENEASPSPLGDTNPLWALEADPPVGGFRGYGSLTATTALTHRERPWVVSGHVHLLSNSQANAIMAEQTADISRAFAGSLAQQLQEGMTTEVEAQTQNASGLTSPGGSAIVKWYTVDVSGATAKVHCLEVVWLQVDTVTPASATSPARVRSLMARGQDDERLTLQRRSDGRWKVLSLDATPRGPTG